MFLGRSERRTGRLQMRSLGDHAVRRIPSTVASEPKTLILFVFLASEIMHFEIRGKLHHLDGCHAETANTLLMQ